MLRSKGKKRGIVALVLLLFLVLLMHFSLPYCVVNTQWLAVPTAFYDTCQINSSTAAGSGMTKMQITNAQNEKLVATGCFVPNAKGTIIMLHGIRISKEYFYCQVNRLNAWGYNVVMPDHRAHGESEGTYCSFGQYEKQDVVQWINTIKDQSWHMGTIGVWGQSLGGAVALQTLEICSEIDFGIVESAFAHLDSTVYNYMDLVLPFLPTSYKKYLYKRASAIAHFPVSGIQPVLSARNIQQAVLVVHGGKDIRIPPHNGRKIFAQLQHPQKQWLLVPDAGHKDLWKKGGENYFGEVGAFIKQFSP